MIYKYNYVHYVVHEFDNAFLLVVSSLILSY